MKGNKHNGNGNPWMVCMRIGDHGIVGGSRHFPSYDKADVVRKEMLLSPSVRAQRSGSIGVLVMHYKKFQLLVSQGKAVTIARIKANEMAMPGLAELSVPSQVLQEVDTEKLEAWNQHVKAHIS